MVVGRKPEPAASHVNRANDKTPDAIATELTSILTRMNDELSEQHIISAKSANELHKLRLSVERRFTDRGGARDAGQSSSRTHRSR